MLTTPRNPDLIKKWEDFFNHPTNKARWTSRFLYEHLFLARFYFEESPGEFYELVRSGTPADGPIRISPTLKAFQRPPARNWNYRLMKVHSTVVDKNHFVYEVNNNTLKELKSSFWDQDWGKRNNDVRFHFRNSNPLVAFKHVSAKARYSWMLKNAHLLLDISARSQNCRSEGAAAPYWDNMLHVFLKPESDATVVFGKKFYDQAGRYLPIPATTGGKITPFDDFNDEQRKFAKVKKVYTNKLKPQGLTLEDIWTGENGEDKNAIVTVLRHQWTASAHKGHWGTTSRSVLLLDFANFERYFYLCNVATEVSEAMLFQSRVVTYLFDTKKEAENNFLSLVPEKIRRQARSGLVEGLDANHEYVNDFSLPYNENNGIEGKENLATYGDYINAVLNQRFSPEVIGKMSSAIPYGHISENDEKTKLLSLNQEKGSYAIHMPNVSYLRVKGESGENRFYTLTANRYYKTRNQLSFTDSDYEKNERSPERDLLDVFKGIHFTFPEKIYMVDETNLDKFITDLRKINSRKSFLAFNSKYGLNQMADNFWTIIDEVNQTFIGNNPIDGGILDLHRYGKTDQEAPL
ncbi:MAG: fatty acid cis/trans isomerase [Halobacteriovoraceae bacterium]|nr:fatty acid cis/trans isomerase [Halobacteriovoraceae bacterium]